MKKVFKIFVFIFIAAGAAHFFASCSKESMAKPSETVATQQMMSAKGTNTNLLLVPRELDTWTYMNGYNNGTFYCQRNQRDVAMASISYASSIGKDEYALGLAEGFVYGCERRGTFSSHVQNLKCFLEFVRGGISRFNNCQSRGSNSQN
jgi:hypothetical protein